MDELRKYLLQHRDQLDSDEPGEELWEEVRQKLAPPPKVISYKKWLAAACIALLVSAGGYFAVYSPGHSAGSQPEKGNLANTDQRGADSNAAKGDSSERMSHPGVTGSLPDSAAIAQTTDHAGSRVTKPKEPAEPKTKKKKKSAAPKPVYGFESIEAGYALMLNRQMERLRTQPIYGVDADYFDLFRKQFADLQEEEEDIKEQIRKSSYNDILLDELITVCQRKVTLLKQLQFEINKMNNRVKQMNAGMIPQKPSYINL